MKAVDNKIVHYLDTQGMMTGDELASLLDVTSRTVRNHVRDINQGMPNLILANRDGYRLNDPVYSALTQGARPSAETSSIHNSLAASLLLHLLQSSEHGENILDLADEFYVSESTLRIEMKQLQTFVTKFNLRISNQDHYVFLEGSERNKRKMILSILYENNRNHVNLKDTMRDIVGRENVEEIQRVLMDAYDKFQISLTAYAQENILMHFAIAMMRIKDAGHISVKENPQQINRDSVNYKLAKYIVDHLPNHRGLHFYESDIYQLALLFVGTTRKKDGSDSFNHYLNPEVVAILKTALTNISKNFFVDLTDSEFFNRFALHVQDLIIRARNGELINNDRVLDIKASHPLIYDIAVYLCSLISQTLNVKVNDSEISLIALHIGAFLEAKPLEAMSIHAARKIKIAVEIPGYAQIQSHFVNELQEAVRKQVVLQPAVNEETDLLVTSDPGTASSTDAMTVNALPTKSDLIRVENEIHALQRQEEKDRLQKAFHFFTDSDLVSFQDLSQLQSLKSILASAIKPLMDKRVINRNFLSELMAREEMSSTVFANGVAMPHSMKMDAYATKISIVKCLKPILWNGQSVKMIFTVAQNKQDAGQFNDFFQRLVELLNDSYNVDTLYAAKNPQMLLQLLETNLEKNL